VLYHLDIEESLHHLFLDCPFAMSCWNMLGSAHVIQGNLLDTIPLFKNQIHMPFFMEIIVVMFWGIWSARNDAIFRNQHHSLQSCKLVFKQEPAWVKLRAQRNLSLQLQLWLDNFV
jgi:hypothetical protein